MNRKQYRFCDTAAMANRCLCLSRRNPDTLLTSIVTPVLMLILFVYVIGGAMNIGNSSYVNYILPGIILQCLGQCASTTAISVSMDIKSGMVNRFCTMPIWRPSILAGHVLEAVLRSLATAVLVVAAAFLFGFRPETDVPGWLFALLILLLYIFVLSWISVYFGILANSPEGAGAFSVFAVTLPYLSSGFVPIDTMPKALQIFAKHQPMTPIINTLRSFLLGESLDKNGFMAAIIWCLALLILFYGLSVRAFQRKTKK